MSQEIQFTPSRTWSFEDQKPFKNITGPTSRGIDVKVYDKCLMRSGFEPRDGAKESEKVHFEQLFSLHSVPRRNSPPVFLVFLPLAPFQAEGPKSLSPHIRKLAASTWFLSAWFSHLLPQWLEGWGGKRVTRWARQREGEIEWDIPAGSRQFQAISSPSLGLCLQADINRILLLYLKRHPVPLMRDGASDRSLSDKRSRKRRYDLTAKR